MTLNFADGLQISLIVFASCVYTATTYGFGTHLKDLLKNGGNLPKAMMVSLALNTHPIDTTNVFSSSGSLSFSTL
jgi:hypothetical protein